MIIALKLEKCNINRELISIVCFTKVNSIPDKIKDAV